MLKRTKTYRRIKLYGQRILAFIEEKLGLHEQFESTIDRWERKGLLTAAKLVPVNAFRKEDAIPLRLAVWDDVLEETRREPRDHRPEGFMRSSSGQFPDRRERRRLGRLYRWQLRHQPKESPTIYDELFAGLSSEPS